ncbi:transpeptidase family protein [Aureibaculum sp. A20]|uniref:Transpeptidase family protein n=1 Tax=Aureibaculum flavum TaxID=2795986 RepID=A0ABS0WNX4_9FLAO|nr:penicillin-binding protein [Aureibaculum flavum]MBJ2173687.1 transpeptidase family protein [Aureibaculum flavum]
MAIEKKNILNRLYLLAGAMFLFALAITYKVIDIQFIQGDFYKEKAESLTVKDFVIKANRGNIYSSDGSLLATSVSRFDIKMDAVTVSKENFEKNIKGLSKSLSQMIGKSASYWENYIRKGRKTDSRYMPITRNLGYNDYLKIKSFPMFNLGTYKGGIITEQRTVREHPIGKIAERAVGYDDGRGRVGIEGNFYEFLRGKNGKRLKQKIAKGQWKPLNDNNEVEPIDGKDVITTIDLDIQDVAHHALLGQLQKFEAEHGTVVVMETKTGEIKGISNLGRNKEGNYYERLNYAVGESHEPGSTFKLMSLMVALEDKVIDTSTVIDTDDGTYKVYNRTVRDSHRGGYGKISAGRVFELSSNVGVVKIIEKYYKENPQRFIDGLNRMEVGYKLDVPIKGEGVPTLPNPNDKERWFGTSLAWMAYGYGVHITPLQTLAIYNAVANNGEMVKPRFIKEIRNQNNVVKKYEKVVINPKIASQATIDKMKVLMKNVVKKGTATNIYNKNYELAGKTGTCQTEYWTDNTQYIASFAGYFPADNPEYSCIVVIHKPNKKIGYYGNVVAAPVFEQIAHQIYTKTPVMDEVRGYKRSPEIIVENFDSYNVKANKKYETMPNLKNMNGMDAVALLENLGLTVVFKGTGKVLNQSLKAGQKFDKTKIIELTLS